MMRINIQAIAKTEKGELSKMIDDYVVMLSPYAKVSFNLLKEESYLNVDLDRVRRAETLRLVSSARADSMIALDAEGQIYDSHGFSKFIVRLRDHYGGNLCFLIGGAYGLDKSVLKESNCGLLSLSKMTFTHQMVRVLLLEQLFRAFHIERGTDYHK